jgi:hypothetical protein
MKTNVRISPRNFISIGILGNIGHIIRLLVGRYVAEALKEYEAFQWAGKEAGEGRLSEAEIAAIRASEAARMEDVQYRQWLLSFQMNDEMLRLPNKASSYQQAALLCLPLLEDKALGIRSMANVGTRIDIVSSYLAPKFPDVQFISVDLPANIEDINRDLPQSPNWSFVSGYALDLFERREVTADLVLFSYTCEVIRNKELHQYFAALATFAKYIVLNEQWWPVHKPGSLVRVILPEEIDPDGSLVGGKPGAYHHNYRKILERSGFEVLSSEVVEVHGRAFWGLHMVARNKKL